MNTLEAIKKGLTQADQGLGRPMREALKDIAGKYGIVMSTPPTTTPTSRKPGVNHAAKFHHEKQRRL